MKRGIIAALLLIGFTMAFAQDDMATPMMNYNALEKKMNKSNEAIQDEKDKIKPKTWFTRGEIFQDIHDVNIEFLRQGMMMTEAKLYMKEPNEIKTTEQGGIVTEEHVYERITLIYQNNVLTDWKETKES